MSAQILLFLLVLQYVMMVVGPLIRVRSKVRREKAGQQALISLLASLGGAVGFKWLLEEVAGTSPQAIIGSTAANMLRLFSWLALIGGVVIVIWGFRLSAEFRRQQRAG